ncbi:MAG: type VII toxin-antitoxin system MntA family adenylyltransferase antitoxin [Desulfobulbaceae bacterium]
MSPEDIKNIVSPVFDMNANVLFAYLFGSVVKGESSPHSDIDIAVYLRDVEPDAYFEGKLALHADLCRALMRNDVDLLVLNNANNLMLIEEIIRNGTVIYDLDRNARIDFEVMALHRAMDFKAHRYAVMGV